jgi:hypothetical protein
MTKRLGLLGTTATTIALATALFGLTACTAGTPDSDETPTSTSTSEPTSSEGTPDPTTPAFGGVQGEVVPSEDVENDPLLFADVAMDSCEATDGGYTATGTAINERDTDQSYRIVVNFTDAQARAITSSVVDFTAAAGETATWEAPAAFEAPEGTTCVIVGVGAGE